MSIQTYRFTIADYARMRETGILSDDDRVELINGEVRLMSPIGPRHAAMVRRLDAMLSRMLSEKFLVSVQNPVELDEYSEPQPDVAILRYRSDYYAGAHPKASDVLLVIEVAETSAAYDREEKVVRYAAASIGEAWVIDIPQQTVEQYGEPVDGSYRHRRILHRGDIVFAAALPDLSVAVERLFD